MGEVNQSKKLLILVGSPRYEGNSATLAKAVQRGAKEAGVTVSLCYIDDFIKGFLRDCKQCRLPSGECSIEDNYQSLFLNEFLNCDGVIFCTPIYWYGMSAQMKSFFDRSFCYYAHSYPDSERVIEKMSNKRVGLVVVSEETFPSIINGVTHQIQEFSRYTHSKFVGLVHGIGNTRGEVIHDPNSPLMRAQQLGREFFNMHYSDYHLDTDRNGRVW